MPDMSSKTPQSKPPARSNQFGNHPLDSAQANSRPPAPFHLNATDENPSYFGDMSERPSASLLGENNDDPVQQRSAEPVQMFEDPEEEGTVRHKIFVTERALTRDEFARKASMQIFGKAVPPEEWTFFQAEYPVVDTYYWVDVSTSMMRKYRGDANAGKGYAVGEDGMIEGADIRREAFNKKIKGNLREEIFEEIDRRYYEASGEEKGTKI
ncbi:MAG: hypothetical protein AAF570_22795, partial [Bacteroidota bacterium]